MNIVRTLTALTLVITALCAFVQGCGVMPNGRRWGQDVTLAPGLDTAAQAAGRAAMSPRVFVPALAALMCRIENADERIVRWARQKTPTSGSPAKAERLSSQLRSASLIIFHASVLATPGGADAGQWAISKAKGYAVQGGAAAVVNELVFALKDASRRKRPGNKDDDSFPSGHAANAAAFTALASRNVSAMTLPGDLKTCLDAGLVSLAALTAWERVEAGVHYPSDVLAGMALGSFVAFFLNDTFMGIGTTASPEVIIGPDGWYAGLAVRF